MKVSKAVLFLIIIGFVVYFNSLFNGFVWDDEEQIINNVATHAITNLPQFFAGSTFNTGGSGSLGGLYYKPLMPVFFSALYTVFGPNPFFFHLFQVSLHITNSILVLLLFRHFLGAESSKKGSLLPFFLALIFSVHPINTEAVIYSSALQEILFFFFGILALLLTVKKGLGNLKNVVLVILLLLLSLLSKETGAVFALVTLVYIVLYKRQELRPALAAIFAAVGVYSILRFAVAGIFFNKHGLSPITTMPLVERLASIPKIIFYYLKTIAFPKDLAISQHWVVKTFSFNEFFLPLVLVSTVILGLTGLAFFLWHRKSPALNLYFFFLIWFLLGLGLHLQIFPLDMTVAERWFYMPMVGFLGMVGVTLRGFRVQGPGFKVLGIVVTILILAGLSVRTVMRNADWRNGLTLYSHDIQIARGNFDLENNYGVELYRAGRFDEAQTHFEESTRLAPHWWTNWNNLGAIVERKGDYQAAKENYQKAIQNGNYYLSYENYANILLLRDEDFAAAKSFAEESLKKLPYNTKLWVILALSNYQLNKKDEALLAARQAYILNPNQQTEYIYSRLSQNQPIELK